MKVSWLYLQTLGSFLNGIWTWNNKPLFHGKIVHSTKIQRTWIVKRWICLYWQMCSQIFRSPWKYWQKVNRTFNERSRIPTKSRRCSSFVNRQSNHAMSDLHTTFKVSVQDSLYFFLIIIFFFTLWGGFSVDFGCLEIR